MFIVALSSLRLPPRTRLINRFSVPFLNFSYPFVLGFIFILCFSYRVGQLQQSAKVVLGRSRRIRRNTIVVRTHGQYDRDVCWEPTPSAVSDRQRSSILRARRTRFQSIDRWPTHGKRFDKSSRRIGDRWRRDHRPDVQY